MGRLTCASTLLGLTLSHLEGTKPGAGPLLFAGLWLLVNGIPSKSSSTEKLN